MATEGIDVVLSERRDVIERYVSTITSDINPPPVRLLPPKMRSPVGTGIDRKRRSDTGSFRAGDRSPDRDRPGLPAKQVGVDSRPDEDDGAAPAGGIVRLVDEQEVASDIAFAVKSPIRPGTDDPSA